MAAKKTSKVAAKVKAKAKSRVKSKAGAKPKPKAKDKNSSGSGAPKAKWNLRLYVAGDAPRSRTALSNLERLCAERLKQDYAIEVIDLTKRPDLAKADQIIAVPTLVRKIPEPMKRIIGDLSNADRALVALEMSELVAE